MNHQDYEVEYHNASGEGEIGDEDTGDGFGAGWLGAANGGGYGCELGFNGNGAGASGNHEDGEGGGYEVGEPLYYHRLSDFVIWLVERGLSE